MYFPTYSRSDQYRRRAIKAQQRAAQVTERVAKATFEEIADNWLALADQADWIEQQWSKASPHLLVLSELGQ
jgi:hypothetical protein